MCKELKVTHITDTSKRRAASIARAHTDNYLHAQTLQANATNTHGKPTDRFAQILSFEDGHEVTVIKATISTHAPRVMHD